MEVNKNAVAILRRSDIKQKENLSFEIQESEISDRAAREGYQIVEFLKDDGISAYHKTVSQRKGMQDLLNMVLNDRYQIEAVFFYDESRLTRQFDDFTLFIYKEIKEQKPYVKFFSTAQQDEWDPYYIVSVINLANASQESNQKSSRAKDAQKNLLKHNTRPGSILPFGYSKDESDKQVPNEFASVVKFIFYLTAWGHSQDKISSLLNKADIRSPQNKIWSRTSIDYIINNDQYLGHLPWNIRVNRNTSRKKQSGEFDLISNHHEPIVPLLLWHLAHQTIEMHKQSGKNNETPFLLRDILYCNSCEQKLSAKDNTPARSTKKYLIYKCSLCKSKIDIDQIHSTIIDEVHSKWSIKLAKMNNEIKNLLSKRVKKIEHFRDQLNDQLTMVKYKHEMLYNLESDLENTHHWDFIINVAEHKLSKQIQEANRFIEQISLLLQNQNFNELFSTVETSNIMNFKNAELRTLLLTLFKKIIIDFDNNNHTSIEYKLSPFPEIEHYLEKIE